MEVSVRFLNRQNLRNIDGDILDDNNTNLTDIFDDKDDLLR